MNMNRSIAWTLRIGIIVGLILIIIGEFISEDNPFLYWGLLVLISSPLFGVIVAFISMISEKDLFWTCIAGLVVIIVVSGAIVAMLE